MEDKEFNTSENTNDDEIKEKENFFSTEFSFNKNKKPQEKPESEEQQGNEKSENKKPKKSALREAMEWVMCIVMAVLVAFVLKTYIMTIAVVDGSSMEQTLHHAERLITWKLGYEPKQGDVIIFQPKTSTAQKPLYYVKRVIATEHQKVVIDYDENAVYVDGKKLDEPYINPEDECTENMASHINDPMIEMDTETKFIVPEGHVFVMGDNRNHSLDSRNPIVGYVPLKDIEGKAVFRFWPLDKMGTVE